MHYYKKNLGDYYKKAGRLSMLQHGAYTLLLDACYDREQFPTEEQAIEWTWASTEEEEQAVRFVLSRFFKLQDDGTYIQTRIYDELQSFKIGELRNKLIALSREAKKQKRKAFAEACDQLREEISNDASQKSHEAWTQDLEALIKLHETPPNHKPLTNNQSSLPSGKEEKAPSKKSNPIPSDWSPSEKTIQWAVDQGATREFVLSKLVPEFIAYFEETGEKKKTWNTAFMRNPVVKTSIGRFRATGGKNETGQQPGRNGAGQKQPTQSPAAARNEMHRNLYQRLAKEAADAEEMDSRDLREDAAAL